MVGQRNKAVTGKSMEKTAVEKDVETDFAKKTEALAVAVENDAASREDVRRVIAVAVRASYKNADWYDHLPGEFVRQVVAEGYIEANLPGTGERLKKELAEYREAYGKISNTHPRFSGTSTSGDEATDCAPPPATRRARCPTGRRQGGGNGMGRC